MQIYYPTMSKVVVLLILIKIFLNEADFSLRNQTIIYYLCIVVQKCFEPLPNNVLQVENISYRMEL